MSSTVEEPAIGTHKHSVATTVQSDVVRDEEGGGLRKRGRESAAVASSSAVAYSADDDRESSSDEACTRQHAKVAACDTSSSTSTLDLSMKRIRDFGSGIVAAVRLGPCKMAIVLRTDVGMSKGKMCAQASHACLNAVRRADRGKGDQKAAVDAWETAGQTKVVLKASSEQELRDLAAAAQLKGLPFAIIRDAGHTQVEAGTVTALAVGPGPVADVDSVTGHLKLL